MEQIKYPEGLDKLIVKFVSGELTNEEEQHLNMWRSESPENEKLFGNLINRENYKHAVFKMTRFDENEGWQSVERKVCHRKLRRWNKRWRVVAGIVLLLGIGTFLMRFPHEDELTLPQGKYQSSGVRLSRSSGEMYCLDTLRELNLENSRIRSDARHMVVKVSPLMDSIAEVGMNTIVVPRGAEYKLLLADGTEVWLNAETSLGFPDNFSGEKTRDVYLTGEAYFKVSPDSLHPFIVHSGQAYIKVLGTSFNVMSYADMDIQQTTLVDGRVRMGESTTGIEVGLLPGMQATFNKLTGEMEKKEVDVSYYIAWKNGEFAFREQRLEEVMETLSRWYGFEYFFQNSEAGDYVYTGKIARHKELKEILRNFRLTEELEFKVKENTVIIQTKN